ncbi:MAG: sugar phosphate isomerase/epimerase [bacterium]|nr:sugar phosphate isomerase/epimerase [bacterium]
MKLGFSTLFWSGALGTDLVPWFERLAEWGYDGVELPVVGAEDAELDRMRSALDALGLARTAVGFATSEANPISPDPAVRAAAQAHLLRLMDNARRLGAEVLAGPLHSAYAEFTGTGPSEDEKAWCSDVLHLAAEAAGERGLRLGVEFLNRFECYFLTTAAETHALVQRVGHPALCTVYDTHHAHIEENSPAAALAACASTLGHVQVSESHRGVLGSGQVHWEETFRMLHEVGYDGWLVVESFSRSDPELGGLLRIWRDLMRDAEDVARPGARFVRTHWGQSPS